MSLLTPEPGLLFWMTLSFGIVIFILAKYAFPPILRSVEKRKNFIDESIIAARKAYQELEKVKEAGEALMEESRIKQAGLLKETSKLREEMIEGAREEAQRESEKIIAAAREQIVAEKEEALRQIRGEVATLSLELAERILREKLSAEGEQINMIGRLLDEMEISKS
ncbi:MAG: F0F1 ATP synthase subunit B [Proteiniphilum sp.]|nr:F0F1 ATP synthase subunit B [Proteiniphilum sp.]MDD4415755.1 F0F1 ATP synthase subunit B [Proteiniphilum sp.]